MGNFNPKLPTKHTGTNKYITFFVTRKREPTLADYIQPETGTHYSLGTVWQVAKSPTTGVEGELWMLSKIVANQGYWVLLSGSQVGFISGTGSPNTVVTAPKGSYYARLDGSTTNDRAYINIDGATGWTAIITAS